jgi:hypothetical protein
MNKGSYHLQCRSTINICCLNGVEKNTKLLITIISPVGFEVLMAVAMKMAVF